MRTSAWPTLILAALLATQSWAQSDVSEPAVPALPAEEQESPDETDQADVWPALQIRVLEHPYALASFYRSDRPSFGWGDPAGSETERYPIASYYRSRQGRGWMAVGLVARPDCQCRDRRPGPQSGRACAANPCFRSPRPR